MFSCPVLDNFFGKHLKFGVVIVVTVTRFLLPLFLTCLFDSWEGRIIPIEVKELGSELDWHALMGCPIFLAVIQTP